VFRIAWTRSVLHRRNESAWPDTVLVVETTRRDRKLELSPVCAWAQVSGHRQFRPDRSDAPRSHHVTGISARLSGPFSTFIGSTSTAIFVLIELGGDDRSAA
jgi:hypothetical protein